MTTAERIVSIAEEVAKQLGDDGLTWESNDGVSFKDIIDHYIHTTEWSGDLTRHEFPDGSVIVAGVGAWDIEGEEPFSWRGLE